jgi:PhzF family phenazine biosynthesis protein
MKARPFKQIDVFSVSPFSGNPVAVVLDGSGLSDEEMMRFARWTNLSETTFVLPPRHVGADYCLRIFTTSRELPFAGHPTLGSCHAWLQNGGTPRQPGVVIQECAQGLITLKLCNEKIYFKAPDLNTSGPLDEADVVTIARGLGIDRSDILHHSWCDNGPRWRGVMLRSAEQVLAVRNADPAILGDMDVGIIGPRISSDAEESFDLSEKFDFEVRAFCPLDSPFEDPVTGSLNAAMAKWLIGSGLAPTKGYIARQGTAVHRNGRVYVEKDEQCDDVLWIGGKCLTCIEGEVKL